jgi:hypothetical protein
MTPHKMTIAEAKQIDLREFLQNVGFEPKRVAGNDHWYLSPLRNEKTPSFKINIKLHVWYDFGLGRGGNIIDLGILLYNCTVTEFLEKLSSQRFHNSFSFHQQETNNVRSEVIKKPRISIKGVSALHNPELTNYLTRRCISLASACDLLKEVCYSVNGKEYLALGLRNNSGGYELRGLQTFKGAISPKNYSCLETGSKALAVTEGMFDYLSHAELDKPIVPEPSDWLILNSISLLERAKHLMSKYEKVYLLFDNDNAGKNAAGNLISLYPKYQDLSHYYKESKDLNEFLIKHRNMSNLITVQSMPARIKRKLGH